MLLTHVLLVVLWHMNLLACILGFHNCCVFPVVLVRYIIVFASSFD